VRQNTPNADESAGRDPGDGGTEDQLRAGAKLIEYELAMLAEAARLWTDGLAEYSRPNKMQRRIVTDVFLLHARNLLDFVSPRPNPRSTDVLAEHYESSWSCPGRTGIANYTIDEWRARIDKLLAHVTYDRHGILESIGEEPRWPIEELYREITGRIDEFLESLPESRRVWFKQ
jgi:hypothetical protein